MSSSVLIRWGAIALMLSGVAWVVLGLSALLGYLQAIPGREDVVLFVGAMLLLGAGLVGLHTLQKGSYGLLGRVGFYTALAAMAAHIATAVIFLAGNPDFQWLSAWVGTSGMLAGFVLYGVATLRARMLPRWYSLALIVVLPVTLPLAQYGTTLFGLVLLALSYGLWLRRGAATGQPSRVR
ncbi:MAG: hypothetical protein ACRDSJ_10225 [Rubrobacteraceae bacterium]